MGHGANNRSTNDKSTWNYVGSNKLVERPVACDGVQIDVAIDNYDASRGRIQDVDVAEESTRLAKYNILVQSSTAILAQANQIPQNVLRLLN